MSVQRYLFIASIAIVLTSSVAAQSPPTQKQKPQPVKHGQSQQQLRSLNATRQTTENPNRAATATPEIAWLNSATEAARLSQETGKPILVYVRSKNCYYCDLLQQNTWQDPTVRAQVMRDMIPLKLTLEENKEAVQTMKVKGFPSVIVFSPRREYISRIDGYVTAAQFQSRLEQVNIASLAPEAAAKITR
jgi:thioredoxin-related protein